MRASHKPMFDDDDEFADVGTLQQIPNRGVRFVEVDDRDIMIFRDEATVVALGGNCTHAFASLRDAEISGRTIICSGHGARFDLMTGKSLSGSCPNLPKFEVRLLGARVLVRRDKN